MWRAYKIVTTIGEALELLSDYREKARIAAGTTDIILEMERGLRPEVETLVDISRVPGINKISLDENGNIHLGPMVTHNDCVSSKLIRESAFPLAQACWEVGSPQIRNRGTIAGNLVTGSPANDAISPLIAMGAKVRLKSLIRTRDIPLAEFYSGVRRTVMEADEILVDIYFPVIQPHQKAIFRKFALRKAQAISVVNAAVLLTFDKNIISAASIALGSVAPMVIHAAEAEQYLIGKTLTEETMSNTASKAVLSATTISDVRGSERYRKRIVKICVQRALESIYLGNEKLGFPDDPVLLSNGRNILTDQAAWKEGDPILTRINGKEYRFTSGHEKTLLRLLREEGLLTGTKEGCAEGECGACTIFLDGDAVMSCLVPAPRAHGAEIVTIEGIGLETIHPVQQAFIDQGAVQCGYCTPGFIMSAVKLLEEKPHPTTDQVKQAVTGNLCRCTGYYKIIAAIEDAAQTRGGNDG